jgi:hypothetical protein
MNSGAVHAWISEQAHVRPLRGSTLYNRELVLINPVDGNNIVDKRFIDLIITLTLSPSLSKIL